MHLSGLTHSIDDLDVWTDDRIDAGDVWRDEIDRALSEATCAVLLVSADFLSSQFVNDHELPVLLPKRPLAGLGPEELETALAAAMEALSAKLDP